MRVLVVSWMMLACLQAGAAHAFQEETYTTQTFSQTFVYPNIPQFAPAPEDGLGWDIFTTTQEDYTYGTGEEANFILASRPRFSKEMQALDGRPVYMGGYMFPLEDSPGQKKFLFGPFPPNCAFHYHVPATLVIEAHAATPIAYTPDPIRLRGTLELVRDLGKEPYYRLRNATVDASQSLVGEDRGKSFHPLFHASPMELRKRGAPSPGAPSGDADTAR